jgi:predicted protein tyrosine phosphatase
MDINRRAMGSAHRVDSNIYIGGYLAAANADFVKKNGITRIVKMFADDKSYPGGYHRHPGVKYLVVDAEDVPDYDIRPGVMAALPFIQEGLKNGERILVHCHAGVSRSSTIVLLHLMINRGFSLDDALARLKIVRPFVNPNSGFMRHLRATDEKLAKKRSESAPS